MFLFVLTLPFSLLSYYRGAVPPFAKFDPFGPPDVNLPRPRRDPDNDHLPPPGYDDMFM